jgi:hypothetical protein
MPTPIHRSKATGNYLAVEPLRKAAYAARNVPWGTDDSQHGQNVLPPLCQWATRRACTTCSKEFSLSAKKLLTKAQLIVLQ